MELTRTVVQLAAAAEPSRLRLLVALLGGETAVGDLVTVLEQSQPRVSRHLRVLADAGLVESFREGRSIFYRWSAEGLDAVVASSVAVVAASDDLAIARDRERLLKQARTRERDAVRRALRAGHARGLHAAEGDSPLVDVLRSTLGTGTGPGTGLGTGTRPLGDVLHTGCGSGELLRLLLPQARLIIGTEPSGHRRQLARARLRQAGLPRWTIRDPGPGALPFATAAFDLVLIEDALGSGPNRGHPADPAAILGEAVRVLRTSGRLLILDRILPTDSEVAAHLAALGFAVTRRQWLPGRAPDRALFLASRPAAITARTGTDD